MATVDTNIALGMIAKNSDLLATALFHDGRFDTGTFHKWLADKDLITFDEENFIECDFGIFLAFDLLSVDGLTDLCLDLLATS